MEFNFKKHELYLLEPQIEILLKCLQYYIVNMEKNTRTEEGNAEYTILRDTYEMLLFEKISKRNNKNNKIIKRNYKKFA